MARIDLKDNLIDLEDIEKLTSAEITYCKEVESVFKPIKWLKQPIAALDQEGKILLFRPLLIPQEPQKYPRHDVKKAIREMSHRTETAHGKTTLLEKHSILLGKGESAELDELKIELLLTLPSLKGNIPEKTKDEELQKLKRIIEKLGKVREENKIKALSLLETAISSADRHTQIIAINRALLKLDVRQLIVDRNAFLADEALDILIQLKTEADNLLQRARLKVKDYTLAFKRNGRVTKEIIKDYTKTFGRNGELEKLFKISIQPYKERVESTPIRKLRRLLNELSSKDRDETYKLFEDILTALDSGIEESLGKEGFYKFLKIGRLLQQPTL